MFDFRYFSYFIPWKANTPNEQTFQKLTVKLFFFSMRSDNLRENHLSVRQAFISWNLDDLLKNFPDKGGVVGSNDGINISFLDEEGKEVEVVLFMRKIMRKVA